MYAITQDQPGDSSVLDWREVPRPEPAAGEVRVRIAATAYNRADSAQRWGRYPPPPGTTNILGLECTGVIDAVGDGVTGWGIGDEACALLAGGGYAEFCCVPAGLVLPIPAGIGLLEAAALPESSCTVWSNFGLISPGTRRQRILIHGGSGGVGSMAIQIARMLGYAVATTAGSQKGLDFCTRLGADLAIDYHAGSFAEKILSWSQDEGVDVVLDIMGAAYLEENLRALAPQGHVLSIGVQSGAQASIDLMSLMRARQSITGTTLRARPVSGHGSKVEVVQTVLSEVWPAFEDGRLHSCVAGYALLRDASEVHARHDSGRAEPGKTIMMTPFGQTFEGE